MFNHPLKKRGFALIELLLVLGIGVLFAAAAWLAYASRMEDFRVEQSFNAIDRIIDVSDQAYASSPGYWLNSMAGNQNISLDNIKSTLNDLPDAIIDQGGGSYTNSWGGTWTVGNANTSSGDRDLLVITTTRIPASACTNFVALMAPRMYDTRVNNGLVALQPAATINSAGRNAIRPDKVIPLCAQANNTIVFRRLKPVDYTMLRDQPMNNKNLSARENTSYVPVFNRVEQAMRDRETAQLSIP